MTTQEKKRIKDFIETETRKAERVVRRSPYSEDRLKRNIKTMAMISRLLGLESE